MSERTKKVAKIALAIAVVVGAFFGILPQIADMQEVWGHIRDMTGAQISALLAITAWNQATYWLVAVAALPGLAFLQAATVNLASTAVANTVVGGGGLGIAVTTRMLRSWGFEPSEIGRYVVITGIWNNFVKLGMPVLALGVLAATGDANAKLVAAAAIGIVVLIVAVVGLWLLLRSEPFARSLGTKAENATNWLRAKVGKDPIEGTEQRAADFREDSLELLASRWHWLTLTTVVGHVSLYLVLLVALRTIGVAADELTWAEVLAAFSFARLITAIPITPGGLGMIELGYVGMMAAMGGTKAAVVAGVLVFRVLTYALPVPLGALAYVLWRSRSDWREEDGDAASDPEAGAGTPDGSGRVEVETTA